MNPDYCPVLRPLDIFPFEWQGRPSLLLRDPCGYTQGFLVLPQVLAPVLALMDGRHSLRDLQAAATRSLGRLVMLEEISELVQKLDSHGFLDGENFERIKARVEAEWRATVRRPSSHAGQSYPRDPEALRNFLQGILAQASPEGLFSPRILIAPHLDISSGARTFAEAYGRLRLPKGARVLLFGTGHQLETPLSVLTKDMETPLGVIPTDREFIERLRQGVGELYPDEFAHRNEHSLEFQIIFLRYLAEDFTVVPFLLGPVETFLRRGEDPIEAQPLYKKLAETLWELWDERTYLVLGIDFAHLGWRYGDPNPAGEEEGLKARQMDRRLLETLFTGEYQAFLDLAKEALPFKICGLSCLLLLARLLAGKKPRGEIYYQEAVPFGPGSLVSIAAAGLTFSES